MVKQNPYNWNRNQGVARARNIVLPNNYHFNLTMDTWWIATQRANLYSDYTALDALYSYCLKSSTLIRSAIDKRLRPLKARTFAVYIGGVEDERLTGVVKKSPLIRKLISNKGMANFTRARVVGVEEDRKTLYTYPLRNLDTVNRAVKRQTSDIEGKYIVKNHVNLFWMDADYVDDETLGLLEPISRDYINAVNAQNNWQTSSNYQAYQQLMLYYEKGDPAMRDAAEVAAGGIGVGQVVVSGQITDEVTGDKTRDFELEASGTNGAADTFRTFKENIAQLQATIMQLVIGSSLLGMSDKNTNSERLIRAHLKMFKDICEDDAEGTQDWLNTDEVKTKLSIIMNEPKLAICEFVAQPSNYIDTGDIETFTKMLKDLGLYPTENFVGKTGLDPKDVIGYENIEDISERRKVVRDVRTEASTARSWTRMVIDSAKRVLNGDEP